jgi:hypothetical protein
MEMYGGFRRYVLIVKTGKSKRVVITATTWELVGFVWALCAGPLSFPSLTHHPEVAVGEKVTFRPPGGSGAELSSYFLLT